ncbi:LPXTG cell wall anchor domain-containing protein [Streptomyces cyaneofuscatus]|uniref:LPXTG cell wall anchor domain-containing protein n=1 Tax=Streptomyces cyaneofuscatus TaxID=66883 RepID=A0ABZ1F241_9ACTN|nr:LPXTG cell wall anchor domain-containing protein [Streptomyces cyaneofuscatus]WSB10481.1 LPXTG cell wall anchor domain-containing protein [Streptomyces cyaneofuscatus]WSD45986.1 LPXTG cell wall anchor domain-containing protein [Streptomyces cyaneofuscatus]
MKIRRALAVAAATAVLAPVTLLSSPAAFATPSPTPEATETATASEEPETPPADEETGTVPAPEGENTPAEEGEEKLPAEEEKEEKEEEKPAGEEEKPAEKPEDKPTSPSATPPSPAPSVTSPSDICQDTEDQRTDENLRTSLSGLPSRIVAGSGFHGFKLNVENKGDKAYKRVDLGLLAAQIDDDSWLPNTDHLTLQFKNPETGGWTDISLDQDDEVIGYIGYTDIRAKESFSIDLRLSVDKKAPEGFGFAIVIGLYADEEGNCVYPEGEAFYEFDVLAADADAGEPNEAEPQTGGKKPVPVKPVGNTEIKPEGTLAQTGSDSNLPVIATIGTVAILAGAGVVFALGRRRKGDATA